MHSKTTLNDPPSISNGWIMFTTTEYATRERRAHALVKLNDISSVDENYDLDKYGNSYWCKVNLSNGKSYEVLASYDKLCELLINAKLNKE